MSTPAPHLPEPLTSRRARASRILDRRLDRAQTLAPNWLAPRIARLRHPSSAWLRLPLGILLVLGGIFSFLPVLGLWMLPVGIILLALDIALLKRPTARMIVTLERLWRRLRRRRTARDA